MPLRYSHFPDPEQPGSPGRPNRAMRYETTTSNNDRRHGRHGLWISVTVANRTCRWQPGGPCVVNIFWEKWVSYPIGSMYAIYGNMDPINIPPMLAYIPYMDPMGISP